MAILSAIKAHTAVHEKASALNLIDVQNPLTSKRAKMCATVVRPTTPSSQPVRHRMMCADWPHRRKRETEDY